MSEPDIQTLMGRVVDTLYSGLTGGTADLPLPSDVQLNFIMPGIPFDESAFDFAIAGPFAGPTPLTLASFREIVESLASDGEDRENAIEQAKLFYQQNLLGTWEQWSRFVDFIPLARYSEDTAQWKSTEIEQEKNAEKYKAVSVIYAQAGQKLSEVYKDTLENCQIADDELTPEQQATIERLRVLLSEEVEVEDLLTGEKVAENRDSRAMIAYKQYKAAYEAAAIEVATRLAAANSGSVADAIIWNQSGGIYRERGFQALRDWEAQGYKSQIERAQSAIAHITGTSMATWKEALLEELDAIENTVSGVFGSPFYPATVIPGGFARSQGWTTFEQNDLRSWYKNTTSSSGWSAQAGISLGIYTIGGGAGRAVSKADVDFGNEEFYLGFQYTTVEIVRPWFNPNFFRSRGWRPNDDFIRDHGGESVHSDGADPPTGLMIGFPTKALFIRNLEIRSSALAAHLRSESENINAGAFVGIGPICIGGKYRQEKRKTDNNYNINGARITVSGIQCVGIMSAMLPKAADPSPDVKKWI